MAAGTEVNIITMTLTQYNELTRAARMFCDITEAIYQGVRLNYDGTGLKTDDDLLLSYLKVVDNTRYKAKLKELQHLKELEDF